MKETVKFRGDFIGLLFHLHELGWEKQEIECSCDWVKTEGGVLTQEWTATRESREECAN
jgi:hypothetical protein